MGLIMAISASAAMAGADGPIEPALYALGIDN